MEGADSACNLRRLAVKGDSRTSTRLSANLYIHPAHAATPSCAKSLHGCFFGGKTSRITLNAIGFRIAISLLAGRKYPAQEAFTVAGNGLTDTRHFSDIDS